MIRVVCYCRVSTDKDDQSNSFAAQQRYFRDYILSHPNWELAEIYADEGITGTSTRKRKEFNRMMNDAYNGKFQLILTKEVSRFSRNILDTITYTRELRAMGIGVVFATDRIHSLDPEGEMLLSFLASMAQEESRKTSSRVVWGQTRQMERGVVFGHSLLGYDVKAGRITVNPEGAEIVRLIFQKYTLEQVSTSQIARYLKENDYRTYGGSTNWKANTVIKILKNEKYAGDLIQKKTYTPDYLTHEKKRNQGAVPMITIRNHHEPIISREIWDLTQARLQQHNRHRPEQRGYSNRYIFSGKIRCGQCGRSFVGRFKYRKDGSKIRRWSCATAAASGRAGCDVGRLLRDDDAMQMLKTTIRSLPMDFDAITQSVTTLCMDAILAEQGGIRDEPDRLRQEINRVQLKKEAALEAYFSGEMPKEDSIRFIKKYEEQLSELRKRLKDAQNRQECNQDSAALISSIQEQLSDIVHGKTESEVFYKTILESITVFGDRHTELRLNLLPHIFLFSG